MKEQWEERIVEKLKTNHEKLTYVMDVVKYITAWLSTMCN